MAPKKKKKPASNPARGFATTSLPSKSKLAAVSGDESAADDASVLAGSNASLPAPVQEKDGAAKGDENFAQGAGIVDMTPEELEAHLENSELDDLIDKYALKAMADARREVAWLENERRQLRHQTHKLSTYTWLPDETIDALFEMASEDKSTLPQATTRQADKVNEEKLSLDLWTLERVLQSLNLPSIPETIAYVVELALSGQLAPAVDSLPGLAEALEWYASHTRSEELHNYEHTVSSRLEQRGEITPFQSISGELKLALWQMKTILIHHFRCDGSRKETVFWRTS